MEPDHPIIILRLAFIFLCALPAVRELFQYINDPRLVLLVAFIYNDIDLLDQKGRENGPACLVAVGDRYY